MEENNNEVNQQPNNEQNPMSGSSQNSAHTSFEKKPETSSVTEEKVQEDNLKIEISPARLWQVVSGVLGILLVISIFTGGFGRGNDDITGNVVAEGGDDDTGDDEPAPGNDVIVPTAPTVDDDSVKGDDDAPVTIIEFSDFECPFCGAYYGSNDELIANFKSRDPTWEPAYPKIMEEYVETGKVKYVMRDFPLSFHANAQKAAEAAECAGEQDKYWEMHDILFENQEDLSVESLKEYAEEIDGIDTEEFEACLDDGDMTNEVKQDFSDGQAAGVGGTPSFFVNGKQVVGAVGWLDFKEEIDAALDAA